MNIRVDTQCCAPGDGGGLPDEAVEQLVQVARAVADPVRIRILDQLKRRQGAICACELLPMFAISQPTLSHHLKRLREAGLVRVERHQQWMYYTADHERLKELAAWMT